MRNVSYASAMLCLLIVATGCNATGRGRDPDAVPESHTASAQQSRDFLYECTNGYAFRAHFISDHAVLTLPDRILDLPQTASADGGRYSDGATTFWIKGRNADLDVDGGHDTCTRKPSH
jgi:membrane-bound inhibitor of C-type lysozyme